MKILARIMIVLSLFSTLLAACGLLTPVSQAPAPTVLITSPLNGQQVRQGEQVAVLSSATDAQGVVRVELWVDGVLIHSVGNPSPAPNAPFSVQQIWTATTPGSHSLMVLAYNAAGVGSSPAPVTISVVVAPGAATTFPTSEPSVPVMETPPSGTAPTATWTPIVVTPYGSPTSPLPSPITSPASTTIPSFTPIATSEPRSSGGDGERPSAPGSITDFESFGTWQRGDQPNGTFTQSSERVHDGAYAGKLAYNFPSGGNDFVVFLQSHKLGGQPNQISAWVYGDGSKHYLNVWIKDAQGETWQFPLGQTKHTGWQQMSAWLDASADWPAGHIDGPSNGAIDYPIDFRALVLDDVPDTYTGSGTIYVDGLRCDETTPPTPTTTATTKPPPPPPPLGTPDIRFWADDDVITRGDCTRLRWEVENVREVYLDGEGVVGQGKRKVCPTVTTVYELEVIHLDGAVTLYRVTIEVVSP